MTKHLTPVYRRDFSKRLRTLGFEGPYAGGHHEFMLRGNRRLILPNPHRSVIGANLLIRLSRQAGVSLDEWFSVK